MVPLVKKAMYLYFISISISIYKGNYPKMILDVVRVGNFSKKEGKKYRNPRNALVYASILVRYEK